MARQKKTTKKAATGKPLEEEPENQDPPFTHLNAPTAQRYQAAWMEISSRLAARQSANVQFLIASIASIAIGINGKDVALARLMAVAVALIAWSFVLWIRHNDAIIGLLGRFCESVERLDDKSNKRGIPAWHTREQGWIRRAIDYRRRTDWATFLTACVASIGLVGLCLVRDRPANPWWWLWLGCVILVAIAGWFALGAKKERKAISELRFTEVNGRYEVLPGRGP
jgi:hypothetical protein